MESVPPINRFLTWPLILDVLSEFPLRQQSCCLRGVLMRSIWIADVLRRREGHSAWDLKEVPENAVENDPFIDLPIKDGDCMWLSRVPLVVARGYHFLTRFFRLPCPFWRGMNFGGNKLANRSVQRHWSTVPFQKCYWVGRHWSSLRPHWNDI